MHTLKGLAALAKWKVSFARLSQVVRYGEKEGRGVTDR
jgi:hypothetical protein